MTEKKKQAPAAHKAQQAASPSAGHDLKKNIKADIIRLVKGETRESLSTSKKKALFNLLREQSRRKQHHAEQELAKTISKVYKKCLRTTRTNISRSKKTIDAYDSLSKEKQEKVTKEALREKVKKLEGRLEILTQTDASYIAEIVLHKADKKPTPEEVAALNPILGNTNVKETRDAALEAQTLDIDAALDALIQRHGARRKGKGDAGDQQGSHGKKDKGKKGNHSIPKSTDDGDGNEDFDSSDDEGASSARMQMLQGMVAGDSDDDMDEDELAEMRRDLLGFKGGEKQKKSKRRRNRPGQRQRQLLAQKKYGEDATHVRHPERDANKRQNDRKESKRHGKRGAERDMSRGRSHGQSDHAQKKPHTARSSTSHHGNKQNIASRNHHATATGSDKAHTRHAVGNSGSASKNDADASKHPSWIAKQRQKEQQRQVAFQGQRITFDSDDE